MYICVCEVSILVVDDELVAVYVMLLKFMNWGCFNFVASRLFFCLGLVYRFFVVVLLVEL